MDSIIKRIHAQRNAISDCGRDIFTGTETIDELAVLFRSPKGQEFCEKYSFPDLKTWQALASEYDLSRFGIYVDAGCIPLTNEPHVVLIGATAGTLHYDELKRHTVMAMHGATAKVNASGYALVFVTNAGGTIESEKTGFAKIL